MSENIPADDAKGVKITFKSNAVVFCVKVIAGSSKTSLAGVQNGMLKVKISAAPEKGKANQALVEFLADKLGIKKKFIRITSGLTSKVKQITIEQEMPDVFVEKLKNAV
jgi:hypothetical protein